MSNPEGNPNNREHFEDQEHQIPDAQEHVAVEQNDSSVKSNEVAETSKEVLKGIVFTELTNRSTGDIKGYVSKSKDRKDIEVALDEGGITPVPGFQYNVEILKDTGDGNPDKGKFIAKVLKQATNISVDEWPLIEYDVNSAEIYDRHAKGANTELYKLSKKTFTERNVNGATSFEDGTIEKELEDIIAGLNNKRETYLGSDISPQRALVEFRGQNLRIAIKEHLVMSAEAESLRDEEVELLKELAKERRAGGSVNVSRMKLRKVRDQLAEINQKSQELIESSPEAHYGIHMLELKQYKKDLQAGRLVETPYVKKNANEMASQLKLGNPVFVYGHLGAGKTELAMHVAKNIVLKNREDLEQSANDEYDKWHSKNPDSSPAEQKQKKEEFLSKHKSAVVLSGSKYTSLAEFYGHQSLTIGEIPQEEYDSFAKETEDKYQEWVKENETQLANLPSEVERDGERQRAHDRIFQTNLKKFESGTVSKFNLGPVYKAMEEGRPLIIDEVNAIPHAVLIGLNHVLTRKVGETFFIAEENRTITIKDGYGVIMTGNLNHGQEKYVHREPLDPAFLNRLHKIEQDYLPQMTEGDIEESHLGDNELFRVILAKVMDKHGNVEIPLDSIDKLWRLAKTARITEDCFSGKTVGEVHDGRGMGSIPYELQESVLSMRSLDAILGAWINGEFEKELDFYIWDKFIKQATNPADRAYLYQTFKDNAFFTSEGWGDDDIPDMRNIRNFTVNAPENPDQELGAISPRSIVDLVYGAAKPRETWPEFYREEDEGSAEQQLNEAKDAVAADLLELMKDSNIPDEVKNIFWDAK